MVPHCHKPTPFNTLYGHSNVIELPIIGKAHSIAQASALCHAQNSIHICGQCPEAWAPPFSTNQKALRATNPNNVRRVSLWNSPTLEALYRTSYPPYEFYISSGLDGVKQLQSFYDNIVNIEGGE